MARHLLCAGKISDVSIAPVETSPALPSAAHGPTNAVTLSVVVPAHNEVGNLTRLVAEIHAALDGGPLAWECIIVDDGSTDGTAGVLDRVAAIDIHVRAIHLSERCGQTRALQAGFARARGVLIATLDADLQCSPRDLPMLIAALDKADMACGIRASRHDPRSRRLASALSNFLRRLLLAPQLEDLASPLRVFRADALARVTQRAPLFAGAHRWLPALFTLANCRVVQRRVAHQPRIAGASKYTTRGRVLPIARELVHVLTLKATRR